MDFEQVQVMAFAKKMMGFPSDIALFPTKLPSKSHEKIPVTFFSRENNKSSIFIPFKQERREIFNVNLIERILLKYVTWILMRIPWHFMSQVGKSLVEIDTEFYDYSK